MAATVGPCDDDDDDFACVDVVDVDVVANNFLPPAVGEELKNFATVDDDDDDDAAVARPAVATVLAEKSSRVAIIIFDLFPMVD